MFGIAKTKAAAVTIPNDLEDIIDELCRYGLPLFLKHDDGVWTATCDMFVVAKGAKFEVKSGYEHRTLKDAARECLERVHKAVGGQPEM